jgi:hypothetical protein
VVKLISSFLKEDLKNLIPSDTAERCKKLLGLLYKKVESQAFDEPGLMGLIRGNVPSNLSEPKDVTGQVIDDGVQVKKASYNN